MTRPPAEDASPAQSYPTFWDAIPVDTPPAAKPPTGDAYAHFAHAAEAAPAVLTVDRLEVD
ncbi:hypothetical protein [Urbifossiella limnaea]|uniref:Uncharacterized protein n=1 Tax=Urbifossiella limnaea TaxID=2528023 RepID=A0A517XTR2_9BACT|nr:hypothetical protein [Urbifossiella limnaea]QDU20892.1 hypothetical protein ETAA1_28550 [Urbifossiella limnaea]